MKRNYLLFLLLSLALFVGSEIAKYALSLNTLLYNSLAEQLTIQQVDALFDKARKWQLWGYVLIPVLLWIKTQLIAGVLGMGAFFFDKDIRHSTLWGIVLKAEFVFVVVGLIKTAWLYFFIPDYTLAQVQAFYPLSLLQLMGLENLPPWWVYPLQLVNLFEIFYWIVLALLIDRVLNIQKGHTGIKIVASSYGVGLLIWVVGVMFFTLNIS